MNAYIMQKRRAHRFAVVLLVAIGAAACCWLAVRRRTFAVRREAFERMPFNSRNEPPGSYKESCRQCLFVNDKFYCKCKNSKGRLIDSSIYQPNLNCPNGLWNRNGNLTCQ